MNDIIKSNIVDFDINVFMAKGLCTAEGLTEEYCKLYKNYKILLEKFLLEKLSLKNYDDRLLNSELSFIPIDKENMDFYQLLSATGLKYIYLRNDLYVEKLSLEEINFLINLSDEELKTPSVELMQFIEKTYQNIIDSRTNTDVQQINCYGNDRNVYWHDSTELVFGVRYNEFFEDGSLTDEEWEDNYFNQTEFINKLIIQMSNDCSNILGKKVNFLYYDEFSVKKKNVR